MTTLTEEQFMTVLETGTLWTKDNIEQVVKELHHTTSDVWQLQAHVSKEDGWYMYCNECYLFIEDESITVRNDRESGMYANSSWTYKIDGMESIRAAFDDFKSCTVQEDDEDYE